VRCIRLRLYSTLIIPHLLSYARLKRTAHRLPGQPSTARPNTDSTLYHSNLNKNILSPLHIFSNSSCSSCFLLSSGLNTDTASTLFKLHFKNQHMLVHGWLVQQTISLPCLKLHLDNFILLAFPNFVKLLISCSLSTPSCPHFYRY
jgi:hypothetical protein